MSGVQVCPFSDFEFAMVGVIKWRRPMGPGPGARPTGLAGSSGVESPKTRTARETDRSSYRGAAGCRRGAAGVQVLAEMVRSLVKSAATETQDNHSEPADQLLPLLALPHFR